MKTNYSESASRHFRDADCLYGNRRHANADQLYGLAAECAFKAVMRGLGAPTDPEGELTQSQHRVHVNELWGEFQVFVHTTNATAYLARLPANSPFDDWAIAQRYAADGEILERNVGGHQAAARRVLEVLEQAKLDGVVW